MKRYHFGSIGSTNDYARELLQSENMVIVTADQQLEGRGRNNKTWLGNFGDNIYLSLGFKHSDTPDENKLSSFQAVGCLAAKKALARVVPQGRLLVKYPNDIYIKPAGGTPGKICGILVEHGFLAEQPIYTIVGIGINVNQKNFPPEIGGVASSLALVGVDAAVEVVTEALIDHLMEYLAKDYESVFEEWSKVLSLTGRKVTLIADGTEWVINSMLPNGSLLAVNMNEFKIINNGDSIRYELQ